MKYRMLFEDGFTCLLRNIKGDPAYFFKRLEALKDRHGALTDIREEKINDSDRSEDHPEQTKRV